MEETKKIISHGQLTDTRTYAETHDLEGTCFPNLFARKNANMSSRQSNKSKTR